MTQTTLTPEAGTAPANTKGLIGRTMNRAQAAKQESKKKMDTLSALITARKAEIAKALPLFSDSVIARGLELCVFVTRRTMMLLMNFLRKR